LRMEALEAELAASGMAPQSAASGQAVVPVVGLPVGSPAPGFTLPTLAGETLTLAALRGLGKPVMLVFSDPGCGPCNALLPEVGGFQREHAGKLVVALVSRGTVHANRAAVREPGLRRELLQHGREGGSACRAAGTLGAVRGHT